MMRRPHRVAHAIALATLAWGLACCDSAANQGKAYFDDMKLRAEAGEAVAQVAIANIYRGNHVTSHVVTGASATAAMDTKGVVDEAPQVAVMWFQKAVDQGSCEAAFGLAQMHHFPKASWEGFTADRSEARKWYRKADELGLEGSLKEIATKSIRELTEELEVEGKSVQKIMAPSKKK